MGNKFICCTRGSSTDDDQNSRPQNKEKQQSEPTRVPPASSVTSIPIIIHSPNEILDGGLKQEINDLIRQEANSVQSNYEVSLTCEDRMQLGKRFRFWLE